MDMTREHAALSASAAPSAFHTPESARPLAAPSTPTDSARSIQIRRAWSLGVQDFSIYRRKKFRNPGLVRPSPPEYFDPERFDMWHNGCAHAESIWDQYPKVEDDHSLRKELLYSSRTQLFVTTTTSTPDGAAPISAAAASTPMSSPPPKYRSSTPLVSELKTQLRNVCAARIAALARGRAARKVARDARSLLLARRFRATPLRSIAAVDIARVARSYLARRHFRRGGDRAAAAAAAADDDDIIVRATTTTSAPPPTPSSRRGNRGSRTLTLAGDCYDGNLGDDGITDDDDDLSCFSPHGAEFGAYKEYAHEAHVNYEPDIEGQKLMDGIGSVNGIDKFKPLSLPLESTASTHGGAHVALALAAHSAQGALALAAAADEPEDDKPDDADYKRHMPEVGDDGKLPTATEVAGDGDSEPESDHGGAEAQTDELTHIGTFWSYNGDAWRSEPNEEFEYFEQNEYYDYEYDDGEYHDDDNDHNEEDGSLFIQ